MAARVDVGIQNCTVKCSCFRNVSLSVNVIRLPLKATLQRSTGDSDGHFSEHEVRALYRSTPNPDRSDSISDASRTPTSLHGKCLHAAPTTAFLSRFVVIITVRPRRILFHEMVDALPSARASVRHPQSHPASISSNPVHYIV